VPRAAAGGVELHMLTCKRDLLEALWSRQELEAWASRPIPPRLNSGLLHVPRRVFNLEVLDTYLTYAFGLEDRDARMQRRGEQTAYAVLAAHHADAFECLPRRYQISRGGARPDAVCGHFVSDDFRHLLYASGMSRLRKAGFLEAAPTAASGL
jgi:hypothetical protein